MNIPRETLWSIMDKLLSDGEMDAIFYQIEAWEKFQARVKRMEAKRVELQGEVARHELTFGLVLEGCGHWTIDSNGVCSDCGHAVGDPLDT